MVASFRMAAASSILFTLISITTQSGTKKLQWQPFVPDNLKREVPRLFHEFELKDSTMKTLAKDNLVVKLSPEMSFAEWNNTTIGSSYSLVAVSFNNNEAVKYFVVLVLGRLHYKKLDTYYLITGGQLTQDDNSGLENMAESASLSALAALNTLEFGPGTVTWHEGELPNMKVEMPDEREENLNEDYCQQVLKRFIKDRLRLERISFSVDKLDIKNEAYGSIQLEPDMPSTLIVAVSQLTGNSDPSPTVTKNNAETLWSNPGLITDRMISEPNSKTNEPLFSCVVLDNRSTGLRVLYTSKPSLCMTEAFVDAEIFAKKYVIWDTDNTEEIGFGKLKRRVHELVAKAITRTQYLRQELAQYMTVDSAKFDKKMSSYVDLILTMDDIRIQEAVVANEIPNDIAIRIKEDVSLAILRVRARLHLQYRKFTRLTTSTGSQTLYRFEVFLSDKEFHIYECVVRVTPNTVEVDEPKLEITDIVQDYEHFSVKTRKSMLEDKTFNTTKIPLFWHPLQGFALRPRKNNAVREFNLLGLGTYKSEIQEKMKMANIKADMPQNLYNLGVAHIASRLNPAQDDAVQAGICFQAIFADDPVCYIFCFISLKLGAVQFSFPEDSTLYDNEKAAMDAMEAMLEAEA